MCGGHIEKTELHQGGRSFSRKFFFAPELRQKPASLCIRSRLQGEIMKTSHLPIAVIGAGPVGLAAAAHLQERGLDFVVLEAGSTIGAAMREWGHVQLF